MKRFKVFKATMERTIYMTASGKMTQGMNRTLVYQVEVKEVRPGTSGAEVVEDYVLRQIPHETADKGISPLMDDKGVHLTNWVLINEKDLYWFIPVRRFVKKPTPEVIA